MKKIYKKLSNRKISFTHACEVGVYLPEYSNIIDFIKSGIRTTLVEADPQTVEILRKYYAAYDVTIHPVAIWDNNGTLKFSKAAASTFVTSLENSPARVNDQYKTKEEDTFEVVCKKFSEIDDSTIDLLSIDIEGSEWYVIKYLLSRPKVISIETHYKYYTNPFIIEIKAWMEKNDYKIWYKDSSDTIFVKKNLLNPNMVDRIESRLAELKGLWKKFKRPFKSLIKAIRK